MSGLGGITKAHKPELSETEEGVYEMKDHTDEFLTYLRGSMIMNRLVEEYAVAGYIVPTTFSYVVH